MQTTTIEELTTLARTLDRPRFLSRFPEAFVVLDWLGQGHDDLEMFSTSDGTQMSPFARVRPGQLAPRTKVGLVVKRPGANEFANMVTIGRAGNNDLSVDVSSVSKFHAYVTKDPKDGAWYLHDAGSSNGTWIDGERVVEHQPHRKLEDGSSIQLGPDAYIRFYRADSLYDLLRETPQEGKG